MNKKLLQFTSLLLVLCLCMNFIACGDDDDDVKKDGTEQDDAGPVRPVSGTENGYAWVNLGLPSGLKWATCNVGAANPWDYGDYFAWGETVGYGKSDPSNAHNQSYTGGSTVKTYYYWDTYKYCSGTTSTTLTKYNHKSSYGSVVDNKTTLDLADDAAHVNMGGSWRMPTSTELQELIANCYWEWTTDYNGKGVCGCIVYKVKNNADKGKAKLINSDNGDYENIGVYALDEDGDIFADDEYKTTLVASYSIADTHIFLPAAGHRSLSDLHNAGSDGGYYWSSSLYTDIHYNGQNYSNSPESAYRLDFWLGDVCWSADDHCERINGKSVRGVCK